MLSKIAKWLNHYDSDDEKFMARVGDEKSRDELLVELRKSRKRSGYIGLLFFFISLIISLSSSSSAGSSALFMMFVAIIFMTGAANDDIKIKVILMAKKKEQ